MLRLPRGATGAKAGGSSMIERLKPDFTPSEWKKVVNIAGGLEPKAGTKRESRTSEISLARTLYQLGKQMTEESVAEVGTFAEPQKAVIDSVGWKEGQKFIRWSIDKFKQLGISEEAIPDSMKVKSKWEY